MNEKLGLALIGVFCIVMVIILYRLAKSKSGVGRFFRWYWNTSFKLAAHIPFFGWMSRFIIAETEKEKAAKETYIQIGTTADDIAGSWLKSAAERDRAYYEAEQARIAAEEEERKQEEADLQRMFYQKEGRTDVRLTNDPNYVKVGGQHVVSVKEFKDYMNS